MENNQKLIKIWDQVADDYDKFLADKKDVYQLKINWPQILNILGSVKDKLILDAGCANGYYCEEIKRLGAKVTGIDASEVLIQHAKDRYPDIEFSQMDLTKSLNFRDNSFHIILCKMVLMDIENIEIALSEFYRILQTSGTCVISIIHPFYPLYYLFKRTWDGGDPNKYIDVDDYFENTFTWLLTRHSNIKSPIYVRPLNFYINTITNNGFIIKGVSEPRLTEQFVSEHPEYQDRTSCPIVLNLELIKK